MVLTPRIAIDAMGGDEGVRVMVEGEDKKQVKELAQELAATVEAALN